jgi:Na+/H+ antiporter NhaC
MSCFAQGIIPWGAQLLIAAGLASINPLDIIPYLYYPYILGAITFINIIFHKKK